MKSKVIKATKKRLRQLHKANKATQIKLGNDPDKVVLTALEGLERHLSPVPEAFDCKRCKHNFLPAPHQWIFHNLCDDCFTLFDVQKMKGRIATLMRGEHPAYFEDSDAWANANPYTEPEPEPDLRVN